MRNCDEKGGEVVVSSRPAPLMRPLRAAGAVVFTVNGFRWTVPDILLAIGVVASLGYLAVNELMTLGMSLASVAGIVWGFGTLLFLFLYPLPIFGGSVEADTLMKAKRPLTHDERRLVVGLRCSIKMNPRTVKRFVLFFAISGGLALLGIATNT